MGTKCQVTMDKAKEESRVNVNQMTTSSESDSDGRDFEVGACKVDMGAIKKITKQKD